MGAVAHFCLCCSIVDDVFVVIAYILNASLNTHVDMMKFLLRSFYINVDFTGVAIETILVDDDIAPIENKLQKAIL